MSVEIPREDFALVCYLVLMQGGEGILDKHPTYVKDKLKMLDMGYEAFYLLDLHNMRKMVAWCHEWDIYVPEKQMDYLKESEKALVELQSRGFDIV